MRVKEIPLSLQAVTVGEKVTGTLEQDGLTAKESPSLSKVTYAANSI
jgi:hypothetical protein